MPRKPFDEEAKKRKDADEFIEMYALQTGKAVYLSPSLAEAEARRHGLEIDRQYILRRYMDRGIYYENGLWVKDIGVTDE